VKSKRVSWANEIFTRGGYAAVPPGCATAREELARAVDCIFFAGEATAYHSNPQTVHGAFESGRHAAKQCFETKLNCQFKI